MKNKILFLLILGIVLLIGTISTISEYTGNGEFSDNIGDADVGGVLDVTAELKALTHGVITQVRMGSSTADLGNSTTYIIQDGVILAEKEALNWKYDNAPYITFTLADYSSVIMSNVDGGKFIIKTNISAGTGSLNNKTYGAFSGTLFNYSGQVMMGKHGAQPAVPLYTFNETTVDILTVVLDSPTDNIVISLTGTNFTVNSTAGMGYNLTNVTYYVWHDNTTLFNQTTIDISGTENQTTLLINDFTLGRYIWNVRTCQGDGAGDNCIFADNNFTFIIGATIDAEQYNNYTYETVSETFGINISLFSGSTLYDAQLFYNGTPYEGEITLISGEQYSITATIDVPTVNSSSILINFFWQLIYPIGGESFVYQNLTSHNQNVSQILLGECSGSLTDVTLNFTNWDEENRTRTDTFDFHGTFLYWLGSGATYKNFSLSNTNITNQSICILPSNLTYSSNAQIQYEKSTYVKRNYYLINATLTNETQHIKLFSLLSSASTTFILEVQDEAQFPVTDAYLYIQRYYAGTGTFETIGMAKTDITGSTVGHFEKETEDYKVIVFKEGVVLFESGVQKIFCRESPCTITFQIEAAAGAVWNYFGEIASLIWSLEFDDDTKIWTYTYVDTSGATQYGRLHVYYLKGNTGKMTICNTNSSSASATLTCNVTGYEDKGTIYAAGYISRSPEILVYLKTAMIKTIKAILGLEGLFLSMFILLLLGLIGLWNPVIGIIAVVGGMIILNFMGLASFGAVTIWGVIFIALILLWELKGS